MSIGVIHVRLTQSELKELLQHPELIQKFLGHAYDCPEEEEYRAYYNSMVTEGRVYAVGGWWQAIYYLLTGEIIEPRQNYTSPLHNLMFGRHHIDFEDYTEDAGYLTQDEVKEVSRELMRLSPEIVRRRFKNTVHNPVEIYHSKLPNEWDDNDLDFLLILYEGLRTFFGRAANNCEAILTWIG
jgi:hypothetical protein